MLSRTGALSTEPTLFCTATEYRPTVSAVTVTVSTAPVAPGIGRPSRRHWKVGAGLPLAETMKRTSASKGADCATGGTVMTGNAATIGPPTVLSSKCSKTIRKASLPGGGTPPPIDQPVRRVKSNPGAQPCSGIRTVVEEVPKALKGTEKIAEFSAESCSSTTNIPAVLPAARYPVTASAVIPLASRFKPRACQPLSSRAVPATTRASPSRVT